MSISGVAIPSLGRLALVSALACSVGTTCVRADTIFESATMGTPGQDGLDGYQLGAQYLGARFSLATTVDVTSVGGHIFGNDDGMLFAAIVQLFGPGALPSGNPFDGSTLASTTFLPPLLSADIIIPLGVTLGPGDYALVFGSGQFGATGSGRMPNNNTDLSVASYFFWNGPPWTDDSISQVRFVVSGDIAKPIPEPGSLPLVGLGVFATLAGVTARRHSARHGAMRT